MVWNLQTHTKIEYTAFISFFVDFHHIAKKKVFHLNFLNFQSEMPSAREKNKIEIWN
jgi:hypothetical protein